MKALLVLLWALVGMAQLVNHYEVLGVAENATAAEITRAFKLLVVKHHPDKQQQGSSAEAHDFIVKLNEAYSVLKAPDQRAGFDEELRFFREHGRLRWQLRYRVYPRTNVWVVIVATGGRVVTYCCSFSHLFSSPKCWCRWRCSGICACGGTSACTLRPRAPTFI